MMIQFTFNLINTLKTLMVIIISCMDHLIYFNCYCCRTILLIVSFVSLCQRIPFILTYANMAQARDAQLQLLCRSPISILKNYWCLIFLYGAIKKPKSTLAYLLPHKMLRHAVKWYHQVLSHVGQARLTDTTSLTFYNPELYKVVEAVVAPCALCQRYKNVQQGHGATAPWEADILLWSHVAVDTIRP
jgi:Integrase zinc binding domain